MAKRSIFPTIERIANEFLLSSEDHDFKFLPGTEIAHVAAMQLSTATSMKRIAEAAEMGIKMFAQMAKEWQEELHSDALPRDEKIEALETDLYKAREENDTWAKLHQSVITERGSLIKRVEELENMLKVQPTFKMPDEVYIDGVLVKVGQEIELVWDGERRKVEAKDPANGETQDQSAEDLAAQANLPL